MPRIKISHPTAFFVTVQISEEDIRAVEESTREDGKDYAWDVIQGIALDNLLATCSRIEDSRIRRVKSELGVVSIEISESSERQAVKTVGRLLQKAGVTTQEWPAESGKKG